MAITISRGNRISVTSAGYTNSSRTADGMTRCKLTLVVVSPEMRQDCESAFNSLCWMSDWNNITKHT